MEAAPDERIPLQRAATTVGSPHSSGSSTLPRWTTRSASHPYDRGTGAIGAPRTVRLRRCKLNRSRDVAAARSSLSPVPGKLRTPGFRSTRRAKRSRSAPSAAVSPQALQDPRGCPSTSRAAGSMRRDLSATADRPSLRPLSQSPLPGSGGGVVFTPDMPVPGATVGTAQPAPFP